MQKMNMSTDFYFNLLNALPVDNDQNIPRSVMWLTCDGCNCPYKYGNRINCAATPMPLWMVKLKDAVEQATNQSLLLNSANLNKYANGMQSCGFHADKESLFKNPDGVDILSISFGATRRFDIRKSFTGNSYTINLDDGDLLWMRGNTQQHFSHAVPQQSDVYEARYNLTFRTICQHRPGCPCI